jgi:hypothetical protein
VKLLVGCAFAGLRICTAGAEDRAAGVPGLTAPFYGVHCKHICAITACYKMPLLREGSSQLSRARPVHEGYSWHNFHLACVLLQTTAFGWSDGTNGLYVGCLCLAMLPGRRLVASSKQTVMSMFLSVTRRAPFITN